MSKPRGLYTPVYASLPDHPKTVAAAEALRCDEVKFVGHMVCLWTWCLTAGSAEVFTAAMLARGARWPKASGQRFADALADVGFLVRVGDGYSVHEWDEYGGKVAGIQQADRERHAQRTPLEPRGDSAEIPQSLPGDSSLDETRRDETREDETKQEDPKPEGSRKRSPHPPVDEDFICELVQEFSATWPESEVRERVGDALNHTASRRWIDKRRGVRAWLKRDAERLPARAPTPIREPKGYLQPVPAGAYEHLIHRGFE